MADNTYIPPYSNEELYDVGEGFDSEFIGFTFNNIYFPAAFAPVGAEGLDIYRTSDGNRFNETLGPNNNDIATHLNGSDWTLYWDSDYTQRNFTVNFAFDSLEASDIRRLRQIFNPKATGDLSFSERPDVYYHVKVGDPVQIKYIPFEEDSKTVYKGEGTIQFIAYYPFGMGDTEVISYNNGFSFENDGDLECDWKMFLRFGDSVSLSSDFTISVNDDNADHIIQIGSSFTPVTDTSGIVVDSGIMIDSRANLIQGYKGTPESYRLTGNLYNKYMTNGQFFKLPIMNGSISATGDTSDFSFPDSNVLYKKIYY